MYKNQKLVNQNQKTTSENLNQEIVRAQEEFEGVFDHLIDEAQFEVRSKPNSLSIQFN